MLNVLKFLVWTACAVGAGIFLAKGQIDGRTPLDHLDRAWRDSVDSSKVDGIRDGLRDAIDGARDRLAEKPRPERYSEDEREAIDRIIAKSPTK